PGDMERRQMQLENFIMLQDSMLSKATLEKCGAVENGFQEVVLVPGRNFQEATGIRHIKYLLNREKMEIKKVVMVYKENQPIMKLSFEINEFDMTYTGPFYEGKAEGQVVGGSGELLPAYGSYRLVDLRKRAQ